MLVKGLPQWRRLIVLVLAVVAMFLTVLQMMGYSHISNAMDTVRQYAPLGSSVSANSPLGRMYYDEAKASLDKQAIEQVRKDNDELYHEIFAHKVTEPKGKLVRPPAEGETYQRENATLVVLVRNKELNAMLNTLKQIEKTFNSKFHYPVTFLNEETFSAEFKTKTRELLNHPDQELYFETIPKADWEPPAWIDPTTMKKAMDKLKKEGVAYAHVALYRNMCRYNSGLFYQHPHMKKFKYYWRFEPGTDYFLDVNYDLFKFMRDNDKTYGFTINIYDIPETIRLLWTLTVEFSEKNPNYLHPNGAYDWLTTPGHRPEKYEMTHGYSTCHFWLNFEIGDMDFYRGEAYTNWFNHLDKAGGFYYERWGDAPVHLVGLALFEDRLKIHWFRDVGYHHPPYQNCPLSDATERCDAGEISNRGNLLAENCLLQWWRGMSEADRNMY